MQQTGRAGKRGSAHARAGDPGTKNIALFRDRTWQHIDPPQPTNVANLARARENGAPGAVPQLVYRDDGIGVRSETIGRRRRGVM